MHVVGVIRDGYRGGSYSSGRRHPNADSCNNQRGAEGEGRQSQTCDGRHPSHSGGSDAGDLGFLVEVADVVSDGVQQDDGLPEDLGSLREDLVEDSQAAVDLVRQDAERPGSRVEQSKLSSLYTLSPWQQLTLSNLS